MLVAWSRQAYAAGTPPLIKGPFYPVGKDRPDDQDSDLTKRRGRDDLAAGDVIDIAGRVKSPDGTAIADALVEIWHADANGLYHHPADPNKGTRDPAFQGFGKMATNGAGEFLFRTIKPAAYPIDEKTIRTPHIHINVIAEGRKPLATQLFFPGEPLNEDDIILKQLPENERSRLVMEITDPGAGHPKRGTIGIVLG